MFNDATRPDVLIDYHVFRHSIFIDRQIYVYPAITIRTIFKNINTNILFPYIYQNSHSHDKFVLYANLHQTLRNVSLYTL